MRVVIMILFVASSFWANAQNWNEWFRQKKTQRKYLLEQITALKVYLDYTKRGYEIARKGLGIIGSIKRGDLRQHTSYFASLWQVNPSVRNYGKIAGIINFQLKTIGQAKQAMASVKEEHTFSPEEIDYCRKVFDRLLSETLENLEELTVLITSGNLEMKDNERLKRIDVLYTDMQDKYGFCRSFSDEIALLSVQRLREKYDIQVSKTVNALQ